MSSPTLAEASVQDIQLELIRRRRFNQFDGCRIAASFERHRDLWLAAYLDRFGVYRKEHPDWIPAMSLITLRDLRFNQWNADTIIVLTENREQARQLADVAKHEEWFADEVLVQDNEEEISMAVGEGPCDYGLLTAWWD